jgi:hypothetical protein
MENIVDFVLKNNLHYGFAFVCMLIFVYIVVKGLKETKKIG